MARPPKNAMHLSSYQIKDFFNDESMKRVYPKNPYNVLWFMDELIDKEEVKSIEWITFKNYVLECLKLNVNVDHFFNPLKNKMIDDQLVLKRVKNIIDNTGIDINSLTLATKAVRMNSVNLIEGLLVLGLDPNKNDDINLPLEVALNRKSYKIAKVYWDHPLFNRFALNKDGENYAEIAIKNKQWKFFELILKDEPQMIYGNNQNNQLNVEKMISLFNKSKFELTQYDIFAKKIAETNNKKYSPKLVPERIKTIMLNLIDFCDEKNGYIDISQPIIKQLWKENIYKKLNEKFPEKDGKEKTKKLKI